MGVKIETPATAAAAAVAEVTKLELAAYNRHFYQGNLFEKGIVYEFEPAYADHLLEQTDEQSDKPVWKRHKAKASVQTRDLETLLAAQAQGAAPVVAVNTPAAAPKEAGGEGDSKPTKISVGDDSEIADILKSDEGAGAGETVTV